MPKQTRAEATQSAGLSLPPRGPETLFRVSYPVLAHVTGLSVAQVKALATAPVREFDPRDAVSTFAWVARRLTAHGGQ